VTPVDPLAVAAFVCAILDRLSIKYVIGGSVASSVLGEPRSTLDLDVMIDASEAEVRQLATALQGDFYVDQQDAIECVRSGSSFNAIHLHSSLKVDFFPAEELGRQQIARRRAIVVRATLPPLYFYGAEDLIIRCCSGFASGESSSRQWRDVVSVMKSAPLDLAMLTRTAREQDVQDLMIRAAADAGIDVST
jgi:hypothetical protein